MINTMNLNSDFVLDVLFALYTRLFPKIIRSDSKK